MNSDDVAERSAALAELARVGGDEAFQLIAGAFDDPSPQVRNSAARSLYDLDADRTGSVTRALREGSPERKRADASAELARRWQGRGWLLPRLVVLPAKAAKRRTRRSRCCS